MDDKDIFDEAFDEAEAGTEAEAPQEQPQSEPEPPVAEQPQPEVPPGTVTTPEVKPEPGFVPFGAVLDERDKRKKLEAEIEALRQQRQQPQQPVELPDQFDDNFVPALTGQFEERLYQSERMMSERFARNQFGDETTDAALKWATARCDADPYFNAKVRTSGDPVGFAVREYQRDQIVQTVSPDDLKQFMAWKEAQAGLQQQPAPQAPASQSSPQQKPPRTLASAPSAGMAGKEPFKTDEEIFAETFAR